MLLTKSFAVGEILVTVKRFNPRGGEMDKALYTKALTTVYPELKAALTGVMEDMATLTRIGSVTEFARLATQIVEIHDLMFDWPKPTDAPERINMAYLHYLYDDSGLWDDIKTACDFLDNPNGTIAGEVNSKEAADPLFSSNEGNSAKN